MSKCNENIGPEELVDIRDVHIDASLPLEERIRSFATQIKNPYCFKVGPVVVKVAYTGDVVTLNERMAEMLSVL